MPLPPVVFGGASVGEQRTLLKRSEACDEKMVGRDKFARRVFAPEPSAPKRGRIGFDVTTRESFAIAVLALPAPRQLLPRPQTTEHAGKKATAALSSSCGTGISSVTTAGENDDARILAAKRRSKASFAEEAAAKRRTTTSPSKHAPEAARQSTGQEKQQQQQYRVQRAAPRAAQRRMDHLLDKAQQALKRRRRQGEIALEREVFRRELLEVEKAAMPDETIRPEDLQELGIAAFEYAVTRTRKQAMARPE